MYLRLCEVLHVSVNPKHTTWTQREISDTIDDLRKNERERKFLKENGPPSDEQMGFLDKMKEFMTPEEKAARPTKFIDASALIDVLKARRQEKNSRTSAQHAAFIRRMVGCLALLLDTSAFIASTRCSAAGAYHAVMADSNTFPHAGLQGRDPREPRRGACARRVR